MARRRNPNAQISEEDRILWNRVVESAERLHPKARRPLVELDKPLRPNNIPAFGIESFELGSRHSPPSVSLNLSPGLDQRMATPSSNMDKRNFDRLRKGKLAVDGRIDLHGMTLVEAHPRLNAFVRDAHARGKRLLLVITGKGQGSTSNDIMQRQRGVLRHQVPQWLAMPPLAPLVLQVVQASRKHGGTGAYYVYLRRSR